MPTDITRLTSDKRQVVFFKCWQGDPVYESKNKTDFMQATDTSSSNERNTVASKQQQQQQKQQR